MVEACMYGNTVVLWLICMVSQRSKVMYADISYNEEYGSRIPGLKTNTTQGVPALTHLVLLLPAPLQEGFHMFLKKILKVI